MLRRKVEWAWQRGDTKGVCLIGSHGAGESIVAVPALGKWGVAVWEHRGPVGADSEAPSICQRSVQSGGLGRSAAAAGAECTNASEGSCAGGSHTSAFPGTPCRLGCCQVFQPQVVIPAFCLPQRYGF